MSLEEIRKKIDRVDLQLVRLLGERLELALATRRHKAQALDSLREQEVLGKVRGTPFRVLGDSYLEELFHRIMAESRRIEEADQPLVGFQGDHGSYSEMAAMQAFPLHLPMPLPGFRQVFEQVERGEYDLGIVPVENSTEGSVNEVHDLLLEKELFIVGEILFPVHHQLLTLPETSLRDLHAVYSHPQALAQCRRFIQRRNLEARPFYDTAGAARWLSEHRVEGAAVIAGTLCADLYGLERILEDVEDESRNTTRFLVLSSSPLEGVSERGKSSLIVSIRHEAGALHRVLDLFAGADLNLSRIESRPARTDPGSYIFFIDFDAPAGTPLVDGVLARLDESVESCKFLGSYGRL